MIKYLKGEDVKYIYGENRHKGYYDISTSATIIEDFDLEEFYNKNNI